MNTHIWATMLGLILLAHSSQTHAQSQDGGESRYEEGPGLKLGHRYVLHAGGSAGLGYDLNPAYRSDVSGGAGRFHLGGTLAIANTTAQQLDEPRGDERSGLELRFDLAVTYLEFFGSKAANRMRNLAGGTKLKLHARPDRPLSFLMTASYRRGLAGTVEPGAQYDNQNNVRALLALRYGPAHKTIQVDGGYRTRLRFFDSLGAGSSVGSAGFLSSHQAFARLRWDFLPKTALTTEASAQYSIASCGMLHARSTIGVEGKLTYRTAVTAEVGYGGGWCSGGDPNYDSVVARAAVRFHLTPASRFSLTYARDFHDGITTFFYSADSVIARYSQFFFGRLFLTLSASYSYINLAASSEAGSGGGGSFVLAQAALEYRIRDWLAVTGKVEYLGDFTGNGELVATTEVGGTANRVVAIVGTRVMY